MAMLTPYTKLHATPAQRVAHLRSKGLVIQRPNVAARKIELIGYERLRIYFLSRRQMGLPGKPFLAGITYQNILRIYECDMALRDACFAAVGQFGSEAIPITTFPLSKTRQQIWTLYKPLPACMLKRRMEERSTIGKHILRQPCRRYGLSRSSLPSERPRVYFNV
jgi:hypothetical protein